MSKKVPPRIQFDFEADVVEEVNEETGEVNPNFIYDDGDASSDGETIDDRMPAFVKKPEINNDDIFDLPSLGVMPDKIKEDLLIEEMEEQMKPALKRQKAEKAEKVKKPRKPMSEEHKAKLALAREKALAVRRQNAEERKQMKAIETETTHLKKQKKVKEFNQLKEEVTGEPTTTKVKPSTPSPAGPSMTKKDLEDAQYEAIVRYEILRKSRKEEKRKQQAIDKTKEDIMKKIQPKKGYAYRDGSNRWDMCY